MTRPWRFDLGAARTVFAKELLDALRDRRTLAIVLLSSVLVGPLVLLALSGLVASQEARAERREIVIAGVAQAPSLVNFLQRQTYVVREAPSDYEQQLRAATLGDPVLVVSEDFETQLARGDAPRVVVVSDSANRQAESGAARVSRLLGAFSRERAGLALAMRGIAPVLTEPIEVDARDLASTQARASQFTALVPFFVMMAVLYGALHAALDATAGERERGSLEPLLTTPAPGGALVAGKWAAVAALGMLIAALSCFSFLPGQWLLRSDTLQALFQFGAAEAAGFLLVLAPFSAALSAVLMAVAIRCRSVREAQASSALVVLGVSMLPLVTLFGERGELAWQLWVPALGQQVLMTRLLRGEAIDGSAFAVPLAVSVALTVLGLAYVVRRLRFAALG